MKVDIKMDTCVLSAGVSVNSLVHVVITVASKLLPVIKVRHDVICLLQRDRKQNKMKALLFLLTLIAMFWTDCTFNRKYCC